MNRRSFFRTIIAGVTMAAIPEPVRLLLHPPKRLGDGPKPMLIDELTRLIHERGQAMVRDLQRRVANRILHGDS